MSLLGAEVLKLLVLLDLSDIGTSGPDTIFASPNVWESSGKPRTELVALSSNAVDI